MPAGVYERNKYPFEWVSEKHENVFINRQQKNKLPPLEILNWLFRYDSESGKLFRIRSSSGKPCEPEREITAVDGGGYLHVGITDSNGLQKLFKVHQIIYYMASGIEPLQIVDHRDGDKLNNLFDNLRLTTEVGNNRNHKMQRNNTSGFVGVTWYKRNSKWAAYIIIDGKHKHLGLYDSPEEAYQARMEAIGKFNLANLGEAFSYRHTNGITSEDVNQE